MSSVAGGLAAAVGAALLYGSAPVAQAVAAARAPEGGGLGLALTLRLAGRPIWLLGLGAEIGAFVLEAVAFSAAPATLVAPIMACDMLVFVLLCRPVFGLRLTARGISGALVMGCAVVVLALAFDRGADLGEPASATQLWVFLGAAVLVAVLAAGLVDRLAGPVRITGAALVFGVASGLAYGFATMATRQLGRTFSPHHPLHLFATPTPYVLAGCSIVAIVTMQRALQTRPVLAFPLVSAMSAFLPTVLGATLLGDAVPGSGRRVAFVGALVLMALGVVLVGRDRTSAQESSERRSG